LQFLVTRFLMDSREEVNRSAAEHVSRLRERLAEGRNEIDRQHAAVDETREHLAEMRRWQAGLGGDAA
jgi:hypothetical protein